MAAAFELVMKPTIREFNGRFARANVRLLEDRRDLMRELAERFLTYGAEEAPGGPGHTVAEQLGYRTFNDGDALSFQITTGPIAKFHVSGTGIYGPKGQPIRPVSAAALHFFIGGEEFFRTSVRGIKPNKFLGRAYRRWLPGAREGLARISTNYSRTLAGSAA